MTCTACTHLHGMHDHTTYRQFMRLLMEVALLGSTLILPSEARNHPKTRKTAIASSTLEVTEADCEHIGLRNSFLLGSCKDVSLVHSSAKAVIPQNQGPDPA